jgi:hypothetical protein
MSDKTVEPGRRSIDKILRLAIVVAGIVIGQFILYGPSLTGQKILLPLDNLAQSGVYLPATQTPQISPHDLKILDPVLQFEPDRRFAIAELRAGRFPWWTPYEYGGSPFIWPKYSPFLLFTCLTESPIILAWEQLLAALVAGIGAYVFCRRALCVGFWPATIVAWCYPMTGFFILWQGCPICAPVFWLPWILLAVDRTAHGSALALPALALVTGLVLVSGYIDVAGQVLLVSGLYALWRLGNIYGWRLWRPLAGKAVLFLTLGWSLGFLLAAPHLMPLLEYAKTGSRMLHRAGGLEERPPVGVAALPEVVLPDVHGSTVRESFPLFPKGQSNLPESATAAYVGILATLLAAPLAWYSRRHRSINLFWVLLAVFGLSWSLNLPGFVHVLRLPGLNMMSHNRLVFATSFAILAMMAVGLEALREGLVQWRGGLWLPIGLLAGLFIWCVYRAEILPEPLATRFDRDIRAGYRYSGIEGLDDVRRVQVWFSRHYTVSAAWCGAGLLVWLLLRRGERRALFPAVGVLLIGDLLWFGHGRNAQCDPALYYPEIPALLKLSKAAPGRIVGYNCLPPKLGQAVGLWDVRGYDPIEPGRWLALLTNTADARSPIIEFAQSQWMMPRIRSVLLPDRVQLPPILDLLGVRYVIFRGTSLPEIHSNFQSPDYWVLENQSALPRAFVPQRVEVVEDDKATLRNLTRPEFDPREVAYVETPVVLPSDCHGVVEIGDEIPTRIVVRARMETPGLLVLADPWDRGWLAYLDGKQVPILRTDYAIRGIVLPAGSSIVEFQYNSATVRCAFQLAGTAAAILLIWLGIAVWHERTISRSRTSVHPPADENGV